LPRGGHRAEQGAADAPAGEGRREAQPGRVIARSLLGHGQDDGRGAARLVVDRPGVFASGVRLEPCACAALPVSRA
jgi:hypothetical protein